MAVAAGMLCSCSCCSQPEMHGHCMQVCMRAFEACQKRCWSGRRRRQGSPGSACMRRQDMHGMAR